MVLEGLTNFRTLKELGVEQLDLITEEGYENALRQLREDYQTKKELLEVRNKRALSREEIEELQTIDTRGGYVSLMEQFLRSIN